MPQTVRDRLRTKYRALDAHNEEMRMALAVADVPETIPGLPDTDDLPDNIITPPGATAPLPPPDAALHAALLEELRATVRVLDGTCERIAPWLEGHTRTLTTLLTQHQTTLSASEASALHDLCAALDRIQAQGVTVMPAPYSAIVAARMPSGFTVSLTIARREVSAFLEELGQIETWLQAAQYTPVPS